MRCSLLSRSLGGRGHLGRFSVGRFGVGGLSIIARLVLKRRFLRIATTGRLLGNPATGGREGIALAKAADRRIRAGPRGRTGGGARCGLGRGHLCGERLCGGGFHGGRGCSLLALRDGRHVPSPQGSIHAGGRRSRGIVHRLTVATPRILAAAGAFRQGCGGLLGSRCGGLSLLLGCRGARLEGLAGLDDLGVNRHGAAQELAHAGGQLGDIALDRAQGCNIGAHVEHGALHAGGVNLRQLLRGTRNAHSVKDGAPIALNRRQRIIRIKLQRGGRGRSNRGGCSRSRGVRCRRQGSTSLSGRSQGRGSLSSRSLRYGLLRYRCLRRRCPAVNLSAGQSPPEQAR